MPLRESWVASANIADTQFPLNNLPYGVFSSARLTPRCGVAIGEMILDLAALEAAGLIAVSGRKLFETPSWNTVMEQGADVWRALRNTLSALLAQGSANPAALQPHLVAMSEAVMHMPFTVAEFTDFYSSKHHATNVGTMFRGADKALPDNWLHMPVGYNGRASSVVLSGTDIVRPNGQRKPKGAEIPVFGPTRRLDIELELGAIVGTGSQLGRPVSVAQADDMIFGYVLLNDWSARDIQAWEYQPLGPFQAKAFATSISPWIVTKAALEPFRAATPTRDVPLLDYLREPGPMAYDIALSVTMLPEGASDPTTICQTNSNVLYYSPAQQLAHHASSGCAMNVGDLLGSGTISGPEPGNFGSLLELSWGGETPIKLVSGESRSFIEDGDTLTLRGHAKGDGYMVGFGTCGGKILPALNYPCAK